MAQGSTDAPKLFSARLIKIITVLERFRTDAAGKGDQEFSEAIKLCALNMAGGNMDCPLGRLVMEESLRSRKLLGSFLKQEPATQAEPAPPKRPPGSPATIDTQTLVAVGWRNSFYKMWDLLKDDARRAGDDTCLAALEECEKLTPEHKCPIRELIVQSLWHGKRPR